MRFYNYIKSKADYQGLSLRELASALNISYNKLWQMLSRKKLDYETALKIQEILSLDPNDFNKHFFQK